MKKIKILLIALLIFLINGCKDNLVKKTSYLNKSRTEEYFDSQNTIQKKLIFSKANKLLSEYKFEDGKFESATVYDDYGDVVAEFQVEGDSCISKDYNPSMTITGKGVVDHYGNLLGWWSYVDNDDRLLKKQEYLVINKENLFNQFFRYDWNGKIDYNSSRYVLITFKKDKKGVVGKLNYNPVLSKKSRIAICTGDLKKDYSNINNTKIDTFLFKNNQNKEFPVDVELHKKHLRGFVLEIETIKNPKTGKNTYKDLKTFFEIKL